MARKSAGVLGALAAATAAAGATAYLGASTGRVSVDLGIGRRHQPLGPIDVDIEAPADVVYAVIAEPYLGRTTRAMAEKLQVIERGKDMVLAAHHTPIRGWLAATTVETVRFVPTERIEFRLVRGPVPEVVESMDLREVSGATRLHYQGRLGTDLWGFGARWGRLVARHWEATVATSLESTRAEAQRRSRHRAH
jgi:hypothetical protein